MANCLGNQIRQDCAVNSLADRASDFALQKGKAMGCALCSSATVCGAVEWAMQLSMCPDWLPGQEG